MEGLACFSIVATLVIFAFVVRALGRLVGRVMVFEYEQGLLYTQGQFRRVLPPGAHWYSPAFQTIAKVDMRTRYTTIAGQEVLSADNVGLKVSLAVSYQVADPMRAMHTSQNFETALYLELQLALRALIGAAPIGDLLTQRLEVGAQLQAKTTPVLAGLGLTLLSVDIKDIMFPGDLKRVFAEVVKSQQEGLAALEKARGESAALRNLANAARLLEDNPALLQLRLLQTLNDTKGHTIVFGLPPHTGPFPIQPPSER